MVFIPQCRSVVSILELISKYGVDLVVELADGCKAEFLSGIQIIGDAIVDRSGFIHDNPIPINSIRQILCIDGKKVVRETLAPAVPRFPSYESIPEDVCALSAVIS